MKIAFRFCFIILLGSFQAAWAQDVLSPYYVVIGGFSDERNAQKYCAYAHEENLPAVYAYNEERKIYYVYVRATQTKDIADEIRKNLRSGTVFRDAWVFNGILSGSDLTPEKRPPLVEPLQTTPTETAAEPVIAGVEVAEPENQSAASVPLEESSASAEVTNSINGAGPKPVGKPFVFRLLNKETGSPVNGLVRLQETSRAQQYRGVNGNEKVYVPAPSNRNGTWFVVCHVLGFRPYKKPVVYGEPIDFEGASVGAEDEVVLPLVLERVRRGDYVEMEGVKFYNNAALFTPGSERELDELVSMMEENTDYNVRLHGHTNGNQDRDIVSIGESSDFFNPHLSNAKTHVSSRELSLLRAELVKAYLVNKGIDASRISTKGEGGKQMIVDPRGTLAGMNDRVEVEIRKH